MRGEHILVQLCRAHCCGSSPHARGTPALDLPIALPHRFIPACAGNTVCNDSSNFSMPVHPRMRGEHYNFDRVATFEDGSSPHARGTRQVVGVVPIPARFIPACAGNTMLIRVVGAISTVHPRMRGEHSNWRRPPLIGRGSSPHARGTQFFQKLAQILVRFIPACAGNTDAGTVLERHRPVHPRMRGEHPGVFVLFRFDAGSSPHARGTQRIILLRLDDWRFIPACAGNTRICRAFLYQAPVHPRMRGEHARRLAPITTRLRFIPACAGNTLSCHGRQHERSVHPRMRGEHSNRPSLASTLYGSSPHARGTRQV